MSPLGGKNEHVIPPEKPHGSRLQPSITICNYSIVKSETSPNMEQEILGFILDWSTETKPQGKNELKVSESVYVCVCSRAHKYGYGYLEVCCVCPIAYT